MILINHSSINLEMDQNKPKMAYSRDAFPRDYRDRLERELEREIREGLER